MNIGRKIDKVINKSLECVEKQLKSNLLGLDWQVEHVEDLRTIDGKKVKIYFGITSAYGGITIVSFLNHGGGYVPYYIKLEEISYYQTQLTILVTGSEDTLGDYGQRNENIAEQLVEMCEKDCTNKSFKEKVKGLFKKI